MGMRHVAALAALAVAAPALADDAPVAPEIVVGPVESVTFKERVELKGLALDTCLAAPALPATTAPGGGQLVLEVVLKRGKVSVVTVASVDPGLEWITPCLQRELATYEWPVKQGKLAVPVTVAPRPAPEPEPEPAPAPAAEAE